MATFTKVYQFTEDLMKGVHDFSSHTFKVAFTNTAPTTSNAVFGDITEISAGNGYTAGGATSAVTLTTSSGTAKAVFADVTVTATGGTIGPFRYIVVYNSTPTSPNKPLIGYADYGSSQTLNDGESFTTDFSDTNGLLQTT